MNEGGHSSQGSSSRVTRWLRAHWRGLVVGVLAGGGAPVGIIAGWASEGDRGWWLLGAGICGGLAAVISMVPRRDLFQEEPPRTVTEPSGDVSINGVSITAQGLPASLEERRRWSIPPPVQSFTGREELLLTIRAQLTREGATALIPTTALYGMGGVGKTQLALAYAHKYRSEYRLGWWVPADSELSITTAYAELAVALGMSTDLSPRELADSARELLAERADWLLVFDNAGTPKLVADFLPAAGNGHVLLTSRSLAWQGIADRLPVDVLSLNDAVELLRKRSGDSDRQAGETLAAELGRLALALEQAAAYSNQHLATEDRPLARYLTLFRERHAELLARGEPLAYSGTVDATFTLAVDQLRHSNPAAVPLLEIVGLLATDEIPMQLLLSRPEHLPTPTADAARDSLDSREMITALVESGLLTPDLARSGVARTHRIIQMVTVAHLSGRERRQRIEQAVELLASLFPDEGWIPNWQPRSAELLPHAQSIIDHANSEQITTPAFARLLLRVGNFLRGSRLALWEALDLHEKALSINQRLYQGNHPSVARSLNELANDLRRLGILEEARELHMRALKMRRRLYRRDHPDIARSLSSLAADLRRLGKAEQARDLDNEALQMRRRLYQGDHPDLARSLFGLAMDLRVLDEVDRAKELDTQALEMRQQLYNGDNPAISYSIGNLAVDLQMLGEAEQARALDSQGLEMCRRLYHGDHPDIATHLSNLASALFMLQEFDQAWELDMQGLEMRQQLYEGDHVAIAESLLNLAVDMRALSQADKAKELRLQAFAIYRRLAETEASHGSQGHSGLNDVAIVLIWTGKRLRAFDD